MLNSPKMLPWLARRAGVSDARAQELWVESVRHATARSEWVGNAEFWKLAVDRLLALLEKESRAQPRLRLTSWVRFQTRMGLLPLIAANGFALVWSATLRNLTQAGQQRRAA